MSSTRARTACPRTIFDIVRLSTPAARSVVVGTIVLTLAAPIGSALAAPPGPVSTRRAELDAQQKGDAYHFSRVERCLMRKINRKRSSNGLHRLEWDMQIGYVGRVHADRMASAGAVWHDEQIGQEVTHWRALGQNTGRGRRCGALFHSFYRSPTHRANILGRWRYLGVGARRAGGRLYVQQVFESRRNPGNIYHHP